MNRRGFLQALFAVPVLVAPLLVPVSVAGPPTKRLPHYTDYYTTLPVSQEAIDRFKHLNGWVPTGAVAT